MAEKKKKADIPKPILCRHCKKCGKWFIASHPKDPQELCERCRSGKHRQADRKD